MAVPRRGVLRHKQLAEAEAKDKFEDLLVFGYACKLFRDDERASEIDQGKLLIPWMGDDTIKIDRYDARGTLFDLKPHEAPQGGHDRTGGLTSEERRIEKLCDEERYFALYKDEAEEAVIKEEEIKRLNQDLSEVTSEEISYHQVPFSYTSSTEVSDLNSKEVPLQSALGELGDAVYVPPPILDVPPDIIVPPTQKLARIIEKTANFISSQGTQMEIIVKAKQTNNPMFQFLHFDTALHPFYRHVLAAIRNGNYVVPTEDPVENDDRGESAKSNGHVNESDSEGDNYLHPLLQSKISDPVVSPTIESNDDAQPLQLSPDVRLLIDKTASYMSRIGRHLESVVQNKGDPRFSFLSTEHAFHSYYKEKLLLYTDMQQELQAKQSESSNHSVESKKETREESPAERLVVDPELMKTERRKKAALFLDQMRRDKVAGKEAIEETETAEVASTSSSSKKSKSGSPDDADVEIIGAISGETRERSRSLSTTRSMSRSPSERRRRTIRRRSRSRSPQSSRTRYRSVSRTRRSRSRSRNRPIHRSPSPRRPHKKHRSRDRHRK
ncbi:hypothetical protein DAPPUDRAFT_226343, partial [Daphnia pulex]